MTLVVPDGVTPDLASMTLEQLAERANDQFRRLNEELDEAVSHLSSGVLYGIEVGKALLEVRKRHTKSTYRQWVVDNFDGSVTTATQYQKWATWEAHILASGERLNVVTIRRFLRGFPALPRANAVTDEDRENLRQMRAEGKTWAEISEEVGVSPNTLRNRMNPEAAQRRMARWKAAQKALAEKDRQMQRDQLAKERGGNLGKAYDQVRKLMPTLDAAIPEGLPLEARALAVRLEDEIFKALS